LEVAVAIPGVSVAGLSPWNESTVTTAQAGERSTPDLARPLRRALRRHAIRVEALRQAESDYRDVSLVEALRQKRGSGKRVSSALDALVDAVVDLQGAQVDVLAIAADRDTLLDLAGTLGKAFLSADREHAGYLAARTYDQVREAARPNTARVAAAAASRGVASA
jgi:hypothetical protein